MVIERITREVSKKGLVSVQARFIVQRALTDLKPTTRLADGMPPADTGNSKLSR
jgi:hypothetical protein